MIRFYQSVFHVSRARWWQVVAATIIGAAAGFWASIRRPQRDIPTAGVMALCAGMGFVSSVLLLLKDATSQWWSVRRAKPTMIDRLLVVDFCTAIIVATLVLVIGVVIVMLAFIEPGRRR